MLCDEHTESEMQESKPKMAEPGFSMSGEQEFLQKKTEGKKFMNIFRLSSFSF